MSDHSVVEGAQRSCFEFKLVQYTTAAILVAFDLSSICYFMYFIYVCIYCVNAGHGTL